MREILRNYWARINGWKVPRDSFPFHIRKSCLACPQEEQNVPLVVSSDWSSWTCGCDEEDSSVRWMITYISSPDLFIRITWPLVERLYFYYLVTLWCFSSLSLGWNFIICIFDQYTRCSVFRVGVVVEQRSRVQKLFFRKVHELFYQTEKPTSL